MRSTRSRRRWASEGTRRRSGVPPSERRCRAAPSTTTARRTRLPHTTARPICDPVHLALTPHALPRDRRDAVRVVQHYGRLPLRRPPVRRAAGLAVARLLAAPRRRRPRRRRRGARARRAVDRPVVRPLGRRRQRGRAAAGAGEHAARGGGGGAAGRGRRRRERAALRTVRRERVPRPVVRVKYFFHGDTRQATRLHSEAPSLCLVRLPRACALPSRTSLPHPPRRRPLLRVAAGALLVARLAGTRLPTQRCSTPESSSRSPPSSCSAGFARLTRRWECGRRSSSSARGCACGTCWWTAAIQTNK